MWGEGGLLVNWLPNRQLKNKEVLYNLKGLSEDGGGGIFSQKTSATLSVMTTYRMSLISAGSISLDSTFKHLRNFFRTVPRTTKKGGNKQAGINQHYSQPASN